MNLSNKEKSEVSLKRKLTQLNTSLGPIVGLLEEPDTTDIMINPDGKLWVEKLGVGTIESQYKLSFGAVESIIKLVATNTEQVANSENPIISAELPGLGYRFEGCLPPVTQAPTICIRKPTADLISLEEMISNGTISVITKDYIRNAITNYKNILIAGGTGSGKTTLALAILNEIAVLTPDDRISILEDTRELYCNTRNKTSLKTTDFIDMTALLKSTMRQNPDRIIMGEVRGPEALALLKSWSTGHPGGISTIHANDCKGSLYRLEQLVLEAIQYPQPELIGEAVDVVIYVKKVTKDQRQVTQILEVNGFHSNKYITREITVQ